MSSKSAMNRSPNVMLDKIVRISSWPLILVMLIFFVTGYAMSNQFGFGRLIDAKRALALHNLMHVPLLALVALHSLPAMWLAFRRWGWIDRQDKQ